MGKEAKIQVIPAHELPPQYIGGMWAAASNMQEPVKDL